MSWCSIEEEGARVIAAGKSLFYVLLDITLAQALPTDHWISYELSIKPVDADWTGTAEWAPELTSTGYALPGFVIASEARSLLHGSCRKPHHSSGDGLVVADTLLADIVRGGAVDARLPHWPPMLVMTGDQVYVDDVAGPMLRAIHALLGRLPRIAHIPSRWIRRPISCSSVINVARVTALVHKSEMFIDVSTFLGCTPR